MEGFEILYRQMEWLEQTVEVCNDALISVLDMIIKSLAGKHDSFFDTLIDNSVYYAFRRVQSLHTVMDNDLQDSVRDLGDSELEESFENLKIRILETIREIDGKYLVCKNNTKTLLLSNEMRNVILRPLIESCEKKRDELDFMYLDAECDDAPQYAIQLVNDITRLIERTYTRYTIEEMLENMNAEIRSEKED